MHPSPRRFPKVAAAVILTFTLVAVLALPAHAQPPANDDQANAVAVTALPTALTADVAEATVEPGEPTFGCVELSHTVWYTLALPATTTVQVDTAGSDFDTAFVVWPGDTGGDEVACAGDTADGPLARASFVAEAGTTYLIQAGVQAGDLTPGTGSLSITFDVAPRPTGKPDVFGSRSSGLFAIAVWESATDTTSNVTQVRLTENSDHDFRAPNQGAVPDVEVLTQRFTTHPDGSWLAEEWFGFVTPSSQQFELHPGLRNASVDAELVLDYSTCTGPAPDVIDPGCHEDVVQVPARVAVVWNGRGGVERSNLHLREDGVGFRFNGTTHLAWRDAGGGGSVIGGGVTLARGEATIAVIGRDSFVQSYFLRMT